MVLNQSSFSIHFAQCNVIMLTCYVRSLRRLPSLQATLMSNASNMVLTVRHPAGSNTRHNADEPSNAEK